MPGMHDIIDQPASRDLRHGMRDVLREAAGVGAVLEEAPASAADQRQAASQGPAAGPGLHQSELFSTREPEKLKLPGEKQRASIQFVIPGTPVAKGRPKFARRGNFVTTYTPERTASYENLVKVKAEEAMQGRQMIEGAVKVTIWLWVTPPASWSQKKQRAALAHEILPTSKPDADNVTKGIFDAMNEIVFRDDKQVVDLSVRKRYAETPMATVEVRAL